MKPNGVNQIHEGTLDGEWRCHGVYVWAISHQKMEVIQQIELQKSQRQHFKSRKRNSFEIIQHGAKNCYHLLLDIWAHRETGSSTAERNWKGWGYCNNFPASILQYPPNRWFLTIPNRIAETLPEEILKKMYAPPKADYRIITPEELLKFDGFLFGIRTPHLKHFSWTNKR